MLGGLGALHLALCDLLRDRWVSPSLFQHAMHARAPPGKSVFGVTSVASLRVVRQRACALRCFPFPSCNSPKNSLPGLYSKHLLPCTVVNVRMQGLKKGKSDEWHWAHFLVVNAVMDLPMVVAIHGFLSRWGARVIRCSLCRALRPCARRAKYASSVYACLAEAEVGRYAAAVRCPCFQRSHTQSAH